MKGLFSFLKFRGIFYEGVHTQPYHFVVTHFSTIKAWMKDEILARVSTISRIFLQAQSILKEKFRKKSSLDLFNLGICFLTCIVIIKGLDTN